MSEAFPSKYLKADEIPIGKSVVLTIESVEMVDVSPEGQAPDFKPVMHFVDRQKGLVLNRTNASSLTALFGSDESEDWIGREVRLYTMMVSYKGQQVPGIRVDMAHPPDSGRRQAAQQDEAPGADPDPDDIPF